MLRYLLAATISFFCALMISACWERNPSYLYLMLHPDYLQQVYAQCIEAEAHPSLPCNTIMRAEADFTTLENLREQNPEQFGAQILQMQENNIYLRTQYRKSWKAYQSLGKGPHTPEQLKDERRILEKAQAAYNDSSKKVRIMLAVVAATSRI